MLLNNYTPSPVVGIIKKNEYLLFNNYAPLPLSKNL